MGHTWVWTASNLRARESASPIDPDEAVPPGVTVHNTLYTGADGQPFGGPAILDNGHWRTPTPEEVAIHEAAQVALWKGRIRAGLKSQAAGDINAITIAALLGTLRAELLAAGHSRTEEQVFASWSAAVDAATA